MRPLMHALAAAVEHHIARSQLDPLVYGRRIEVHREGNEDALRRQRDIGDARQVFLAAKEEQIWQFHPGQARLEITAAGKDEIDPRPAKTGLVVGGITENGWTDARHVPCRAHKPAAWRKTATCGWRCPLFE